MPTIPVYYLDENLNEDDALFLIESLVSLGEYSSDAVIAETRVASVFPTQKTGANRQVESDVELLKKHLINAGLRKDSGKQIVWLMPKDTGWGARFQLSIYEITGYYPYVLQRWSIDEDGSTSRRDTRLIDGHGMMGGKD